MSQFPGDMSSVYLSGGTHKDYDPRFDQTPRSPAIGRWQGGTQQPQPQPYFPQPQPRFNPYASQAPFNPYQGRDPDPCPLREVQEKVGTVVLIGRLHSRAIMDR